MENPVLTNRAGSGILAILPRNHLSRSDLVVNADIVVPVIRYYGLRPSVDAIATEVAGFFLMGRPAGKPPVKRDTANIKIASTILDA